AFAMTVVSLVSSSMTTSILGFSVCSVSSPEHSACQIRPRCRRDHRTRSPLLIVPAQVKHLPGKRAGKGLLIRPPRVPSWIPPIGLGVSSKRGEPAATDSPLAFSLVVGGDRVLEPVTGVRALHRLGGQQVASTDLTPHVDASLVAVAEEQTLGVLP